VVERAHAVDESSDASSSVISSDRVIKTLLFQKTDVIMVTVADVNLDYAIVGQIHRLQDSFGVADCVSVLFLIWP